MKLNELLDIKFRDVFRRRISVITSGSSITDAADKMIKNDVDSLLVIEKGKPIGIVTDKDIVKAVAKKLDPLLDVKSIMTKTIITINGDEDILEILNTMLNNEIRHLVIRRNGDVVGTITRRDIIGYMLLFSKEWPTSWS